MDKKTGFVYELGHRLLDGNRIERNPDQVVIGGSLLRRKSNGKRRPPIYSIKGGLLNDIDVKIEASARGRKRTRVELDWTFKIKEGTKMPQKGEWKAQRWSKCLTQRGTRSDVSSLSLNPNPTLKRPEPDSNPTQPQTDQTLTFRPDITVILVVPRLQKTNFRMPKCNGSYR